MSLQDVQKKWQLLHTGDISTLQPAIDQIHRGVQFIAMLGKHFLPNKPDDSHTNMGWLDQLECLAGNLITAPNGSFQFGIRSKDLTFLLINSDHKILKEFTLSGKTKNGIFTWLEEQLAAFGLDSSHYKMDIHYDIPYHETDDGTPFQLKNPSVFQEWAKIRANSHFMLNDFALQTKTASSVRTWPHHFDTGTYIPLIFNESNEAIKSMSLGFAIPDSVITEPYFYVTQWSKEGGLSYEGLQPLSNGQWLPEKLGGSALKISAITALKNSEDQAKMVYAYFEESIAASKRIIGVRL
jgi:hypothetical protein